MKKKLILSIVTVASILAMLITSGAVGVFAEKNETETPELVDTGAVGDGNTAGTPDNTAAPLFTGLEQFEKIASSDSKELYMLDLKKQALVFAVKDIKNGTVLYSSPANSTSIKDEQTRLEVQSVAVINYQDKKTVVQKASAASAVAAGNYSVEKLKDNNGVRVTFKYPDVKKGLGFTVPMTFALTDDHFDVSVEMNSIKTDKKSTSDILSVSVMPYFGCASYGQEGYLLLPDGSGALMDNSFKALDNNVKYYSTYVYNRDAALGVSLKLGTSQSTTLPVFGTKLGNQAWLGVIETGDSVSLIKAVSARESFPYTTGYCELLYNKTDSFKTKTTWNIKDYQQITYEPTDADKLTVRYYGLDGDDADYVGMASTYREYLIEQGATGKISEDLPFYAETIGAFKKTESVMGFVTKVTETMTTADEAKKMIGSLEKKGIKNINLRYTGWMKGGIDGSVVTNANMEPKLGNAKDLIELNKMLGEQNGRLYLELEIVNIYKGKSGWKPNKFAVRNILDQHATQYLFSRNVGMPTNYSYYLCRPQFFKKELDGFFKDFGKYEGITGISAGSLGNSNYSNLSDTAEQYTDAYQTNQYILESLAEIRKKVGDNGSVLVDAGNGYSLKYADTVAGVPLYCNGYEFTYTDVPFVQIALHGIVNIAETPHNLTFDVETQLLRQFETGTAPYYLLTHDESSEFLNTRLNYIYTSQYTTWETTAAENYKALSEAFDGYNNKPITDHEIITDNVRATTFGDDRTVLVNYGTEEYSVGSIKVPARGHVVTTRSEYDAAKGTDSEKGGNEQ